MATRSFFVVVCNNRLSQIVYFLGFGGLPFDCRTTRILNTQDFAIKGQPTRNQNTLKLSRLFQNTKVEKYALIFHFLLIIEQSQQKKHVNCTVNCIYRKTYQFFVVMKNGREKFWHWFQCFPFFFFHFLNFL
jgi:hypothetical protein